ncbi:cupin domain-containing protein [Pectobacterium brasiliense]|uniref:cupin domain-containing protein n=1 Tax=Pectobacterium brasiliense TaxID=180957 RepID=UPI00202D8435|nr:cupin domain-containing protein [Pectobacterium brasiliense]MCL6379626.1 cupin domain-containing protein [Pectobacterium brasiliense]
MKTTHSERDVYCQRIAPQAQYQGKQGLVYSVGISRETVGAQHLHMQLAWIPPRSQGKAHKHEHHETAIYTLSGISCMYYGEQLENWIELPEGNFLYIPENVPHLPYNPSDDVAVLVISRTDANDQESVIMLPELDRNVLPERGEKRG